MSRYYGKIGFIETDETSPGVWSEEITEKSYSGEWRRVSKSWQSNPNGANDNVSISNELSVIADPYLNGNFHHMKYVTWLGTKWKISKVDMAHPRVNITIGEVYNGEED